MLYCYGLDKDITGNVGLVYLVKVSQDLNTSAWIGAELLPPMSLAECGALKIENISVSSSADGAELCPCITAERLPVVHSTENGFVQLTIKPFVGKYHKLNPKKLWPSKTALLRTITVLGETVRKSKKYITYWMTNRRIQLLDENYTEYGYYVCDYNGAIAYLTFDQMQLIGNRYGFTNARINGTRITALDGSSLPQFSYTYDANDVRNDDKVSYITGDVSVSEYEISILRQYADSFFSIRRQQLSFDEDSSSELIQTELNELVSSVQAFHQALLWGSVPKTEYERIQNALPDLFAKSESDYNRIKREILSGVHSSYFELTDAFDTMLKKCGTNTKRLANIQTLTALSKDIQDRYCAILLAEQEITQVLMSLGQEYSYELFGLEYRMKSPDSLYEKLYERCNDTNKSIETLFEESRDILRYTVCFDREEDYCENIVALLENVMDRFSGQVECFRNYWTPYVSGEYKGINVSVRLPEMCWDKREKRLRHKRFAESRYCVAVPSFCFEVQFHTQTSLSVKEHNHKLYERNRRSDVSAEERQRNNEEMKKNISSVTTPAGAAYLNMMSNEYIEALQDSISLMRRELCEIGKKNYPYVNMEKIKQL